MKIVFLLPALLGLAAPLRAQSPGGAAPPVSAPARPEPPPGPLLRPAAHFSEWEIVYTYPAEHQKKDDPAPGAKAKPLPPGTVSHLRKTITTKTGPIVHERQIDTLGRTVESWFNGRTQYCRSSENPLWGQSVPGTPQERVVEPRFSPLPPTGFRDLGWINAENFAGSVPYGSGTCLIFAPGGYRRLDLSDPAQRSKRLSEVEMIAYIDADSRLPLALRTRNELRSYHFNEAPTQMQTLPVDLSVQIKQGAEGRARLEAPPPRPY